MTTTSASDDSPERAEREPRFVVLTIVLLGAISGVLAVLFHGYVELARALMIGRALHGPRIFVVLVPAVVFMLLALAIRRFAPRAVGANLARVRMAYTTDPSLLGPRSVGATFLATPISLGAGAPLGPEGPIVVVTSGVSIAIARLLRMPRRLVRAMIPVGVAAGIGAIFNTPITGVVFALEEVLGSAERGALGGVIIGAVSAAVVERQLMGGKPLLVAPDSSWNHPLELIGFAVIGIVSGVVSGYAIAVMHRLKRVWTARVPSIVARAGMAGLMIGALGLLAPSILGVGYDSVSVWLHGGGTTTSSGVAFAVKVLAFVLAVSSGILGGTFAPSLFMGAALGAAIGHGAHHLFPRANIDPKAYALIGMGSFFAGLLRSPIAAVLIVIELTRDYELVVPLMLGVSLSVAISRRISRLSVVEQQMLDEGYVEAREHAGDPLVGVRVEQTMSRAPLTLRADMPLRDCAPIVAASRHRVFPVVDGDGRLVGIAQRHAVLAAAPEALASSIAEAVPLAAAESELVLDVVQRMKERGIDRCPVIDEAGSVVGFLSPSDLLRVRTGGNPLAMERG